MLKGAIFDHDGLMFDTEKIWQANWHRAAEEIGVELPADWVHHISGTSGSHMKKVIEKYYHLEDGSELQAKVMKRVQEDEAVHIDAKKGLQEILDMFKKNGVKMAVASSSPRSMIERNLRNGKVDGYFDAVVSSTEVQHGKPEPDVFLKAAELLNLKPAECYVFEDAYNGVRAGHAAGCFTIMIPDQVQPDADIRKIANGIFATLCEASFAIEKKDI
jgi:HAD superfamily hydrolase (TIGR01509 family)